MLDRAGDADRNVQLGRHDLAGLPHLPVIGNIARIHCRARRAHRRTELVSQRFEDLETLAGAHAAPAGHDDPGGGQLGPV